MGIDTVLWEQAGDRTQQYVRLIGDRGELYNVQLINYFSNNNSVNRMQRMLYSFAYAYYPHLTC